MNDRKIWEIVDSTMKLSDLFVGFHCDKLNENEISIKSDDLKIILPFLFFHPKFFSSIDSESIFNDSSISFRLSYMKELYEGQDDFEGSCYELPQLYEECQTIGQKISFLKCDLERIETNSEQPKFLTLLQYAPYISDCLPILYAKYYNEFKLSTFVNVAFSIGEIAIKSFCFCFPNVICPCFQTALMRHSTPNLLAFLITLSPNHRGILLPKVEDSPILYSILAIKLFPENPSLPILSLSIRCSHKIKKCLREIPAQNRPFEFFKLYARCCATTSKIDDEDFEILKNCKNDPLIIATLFTIENTQEKYFDSFVSTFKRKAASLGLLLEFECYQQDNNNKLLLNKIKEILGEDTEWVIKATFSNFLTKVYFQQNVRSPLLEDIVQLFMDPTFSSGSVGIYILGSFLSNLPTSAIQSALPILLNNLSEIDRRLVFFLCKCIDDIFSYPDQSFNITDYISNILRYLQDAFILEKIIENPFPAIAATIIILTSSEKNTPQKQIFLSQANDLPIRFILLCASKNKGCEDILLDFCNLCNSEVPYLFYQPQLLTKSPELLLSKGDPYEFLNNLKNNIGNPKKDIFKQWLIYRFISPFQYIIDTLDCLNGSNGFTLLHQAIVFPKDVLQNKYTLKIILYSLIDLSVFYSKLYSKSIHIFHQSMTNVLFFGINLLKDPHVHIKTVCSFINELFLIDNEIINAFIWQGCDSSLIDTLAKNVKILQEYYGALNYHLNKFIHVDESSKKVQVAILFTLELFSHLVVSNPDNETLPRQYEQILNKINKLIQVTDENLDTILASISRIFKTCPNLYETIKNFLFNIKKQIEKQTTKTQLISKVNFAIEEITSCIFSETK